MQTQSSCKVLFWLFLRELGYTVERLRLAKPLSNVCGSDAWGNCPSRNCLMQAIKVTVTYAKQPGQYARLIEVTVTSFTGRKRVVMSLKANKVVTKAAPGRHVDG
jgi:hypothetical protein